MNKPSSFLAVGEHRFTTPQFILLMLLAYGFALAMRYLWVQWAGGHPEYFWNGQLMINTNDGYYWAEGARDILAGGHQAGDLSPVSAPISRLTAFLAQLLPMRFETLILWMPAIFGSLLVVPVMLIGRALDLDRVGFVAAMLAGIAWSYYNRTMVGYYDTDMLTVVLPALVLWGMIMAVTRKRNRYMVMTALLMVLYQWWYPAAAPLNTAFAVMVLLYTLVFERRELYNYKLILFMLLALMPLGWLYELVLIAAAFAIFHFGGSRSDRLLWPLLGLVVAGFVLLGGLNPIWFQIKGYLFRESVAGAGLKHLHFYAVSKTVREAGRIPFETFANRISGHPVVFVLSLVGYVMMALRYRAMWLALPMLALGFLAMKAGLRFTVYAVPVMALGMGYVAVWFSDRASGTLRDQEGGRRWLNTLILLAILAAVLYPNIRHILEYRVPTVFVKSEVAVLDRLGKKAGREDYVLTWWDYGYPIRYYGDVKTLVDGGKHTGDVNYPVSFALTMPQVESANMARLDVEYTERNLRTPRPGNYIEQMMRDYNASEPELFLTLLDDPEMKLPPKSRDIYYYLPMRMLDIFPTVALFSSIDLSSGAVVGEPKIYQFMRFKKEGSRIYFGKDLYVDLQKGVMHVGNERRPLNSLQEVTIDRNGKSLVHSYRYDPSSRWYLIYHKSYGRFMLMDRKGFRSTYIQLFVLGHYDPKLFEPVILTPMAKVYRLKK